MNDAVYELLDELNAEAPSVRAGFADFFDPQLDAVPIPFFGDVGSAKVITVGLNPSDGELRGRRWPQPVDTQTLYERLIGYFDNPDIRPHPWFDPWEEAISELGVSFTDGTAAHLDLCPWPTRPMSQIADQTRFAALVSQSLPTFWRCLQLASNLQLVLMAGAVSKKHYLNEFLAKATNPPGMALLGKIARGGTAFTGYHRIRLEDHEFPAFFCSVSPSSRTPAMLPARVREHRDQLTMFLL